VKLRILFAAGLVLAAIGLVAASDPPRSDLVVHEWGTFLAMNGSDGVTLDGMYHEEHALPGFVYARSRDQLRMATSMVKSETPVIYFYSPRRTRVDVRVDFPTGLWTQWYPRASTVGPGMVQTGSPPQTRRGHITWTMDVIPASEKAPPVPPASEDALWNFTRDVDAAYVTTAYPVRADNTRESERFIFYRGLGEAPLPIDVRSADGNITASSSEPGGMRHLFILRVEKGRGAYAYVPALEPGYPIVHAVPPMRGAIPMEQFVPEVADKVAARLVESGLYEKEARAMVNTWSSSYFKTDGVRVLFVMPQTWTDRYIPLTVQPRPAQLVRVMVGRMELLDPDRERRAESAIRDLASPDAGVRESAFAVLRNEGRYVEPIVRRVLRTTTDERVRELSKRLLLTDFVTELRTALTSATTGERVTTEGVYIRAQLASLLREVGLIEEARQEGTLALAELEREMARGVTMSRPSMDAHQSRHTYRALARASEGAGRDQEALKWYGDFVAFGSQNLGACGGACHGTRADSPRDMSFFRDWYAGRKFAEYAQKTGEAPRLIAAHEAVLERSAGSTAVKLQLAYLYEARGDEAKYRKMWNLLDPDTR
jgi:hypothetical protein